MPGRSASGAGRVPCLVPFCRCTIPQDRHPGATEIICAKHWRMKPRRPAKLLRMVRARLRRTLDPERRETLLHLEARTWAKCRDAIIERAAGI